MTAAIAFQGVDVLFARSSGRAGARATAAALAALDAGGSRDDVGAAHDVVVAVLGASLEVRRGEICVLMGLSGSGKSTLLRAANGLAPVSRGRVLVDAPGGPVDVTACDAASLRRLRRERIAMVFQHFALLPWRTVAENVAFGLELRGDPVADRRRAVASQLELVGLSAWADRPVGDLSGGMQQRVGLARALATQADVLLMDEPFSALDPLMRTRLQDELLSLQAGVHRTILFVSHDLDEALRIGDRIAIMDAGRIVQTGTAQDIVLHPADPTVEEFVAHMNPLSVVRGHMVLRPLAALERADDGVWLDPGRRCRLRLDDEGAPAEVTVDGRRVPVGEALAGEGVAVAPPSLPLRELLWLRRASGHPVQITSDGRVVGVCGDDELLGALAARPRDRHTSVTCAAGPAS